ncbi:MAG: VWA domain-containing protein, partial [Clostridia bacterium]|nr:VWA domain-containing protein [Clostridia bacterium]
MDKFLGDVTSYFLGKGDVMSASAANISAATAEDTAAMTYAADTTTAGTVLDAAIFCSDVHGNSSTVTSIFNGIKSADSTFNPSTATFVGDTQMAASSVTSAAQSVYSNVACYYAYGNHDSEGNYGISDVTGLLYSGSNYYIYAISQTSMASSNPDTSGFTSTVAGLDKTKPLFIASHLPLHNRRDDSNGAAAWYEAISDAAESMDIVFFWAHNHTGENDVDRAAFYVAKDGDETFTLENTSTVVTPNFTYMNAGFVGKSSSRGGVVTTVKIYSDTLVFQDYTSSGAFTGEYSHNVEVAREFANTTDSGDTDSGNTDTDSGTTTEEKEVYVLVDTMTEGKDYLIANGNSGTVTLLGQSSGSATTTTAEVKTSGDYSYIETADAGYVWNATESINSSASGPRLINAETYAMYYSSGLAFGSSLTTTNGAIYTRYWTYSDGQLACVSTNSGSTTYYLTYSSNSYSMTSTAADGIYIYEKQTITVNSDGTASGGSGDDTTTGGTDTVVGDATVTTADDGSWQKVTFGTEGEQKTVYVLVSTPTAGKNYIIASGNSGSVYALKENTTTGTSVTVNAATGSITAPYIENSNNAIVWTAFSGLNFKSVNGGYYLNYTQSSSGGKPGSGGSSSGYSLSFSTSSASDWTADTNALYREGTQNDYYLRYNNGWTMGGQNTEYNVYFYEEKTIDTSSSVTYSVTASDIEHFYTADTTDTETVAITKSVTDGTPTGTYAYDIMGGDDIISSIDQSTGVITLNGNEGTAQVKVSYSWTDDNNTTDDTSDDVTYTIWQVIDVTATSPYYTIDLHKNTDGVQGDEITETIAIKGVEAGDTYSVWAVIKFYDGTTEDGTDLGDVEDSMIEWTSSDETVATVDAATGVITFTGKDGTVSITATYLDGNRPSDTIVISASTSQYSVPADGTTDFPEYPNEGAIRFDKTATAVGNFSETGIAQVELSMTGVPYTTGSEIDVVIMLDMTGSMTEDSIAAARASAIAFANQIIKNEDGTYNNNRISVQQFNKNGATELWALSAVTADTYDSLVSKINGSTQDSGGTPYSTALQECYEILYAAKSDGIGNNRKQFCVFVSDGTPTSVTYITDTTTPSTTTTVSFTRNSATYTQTVPDYSTGRTSSTFESDKNSYHEYWSQLMINNSVTVYGVYTSVAAGSTGSGGGSGGGSVNDTTTGTICMNKVATDSSKVYVVEDGEDTSALTGVFTNIALEILQAATDITVEDKITDEYTMIFDLPEGNKDITGLDSQEFYIEFVKYTLDENHERTDTVTSVTKLYLGVSGSTYYAASDASGTAYAAPVFAQTAIGDKGTLFYWTTDSSYASKAAVSYNDGTNTYYFIPYGEEANEDGTAPDGWYNMTSGAYASGSIDSTTNMSTDLVIATPYFVYNQSTKMLYWTVDKLDTAEYALRYFLYLNNSATEVATDKAIDAATYPTNDHAYITYTNFKGNDCRQQFPVPQLTWNGAQVSYVFYLVNAAGQPINKSGQVVNFANATFITDVFTESVVWNKEGNTTTGTGELSADWLADELLPDSYTIYDKLAGFKLNVYEKADGTTIKNEFTIDGDTAANISAYLNDELNLSTTESTVSTVTTKVYNTKAGTKITGYGTYDSAALTSIDFANTTVAFAVVWEPKLVPDVVVVDYGLDVLINVVQNDILQNTVSGIGLGNEAYGNIDMNTGISDDAKLGTAALTIDGNTISIENENEIRFRQNDMEFAEAVTFYYESPVAFYEKSQQKTGYMYSSVTVIPATTIYYEESFVDFENGYAVDVDSAGTIITKDANGNEITYSKVESGYGAWSQVGAEISDVTQAQDRTGDKNISSSLDA